MDALISCSCPKAENTPALKTRTVMEDFCGSIAVCADAFLAHSIDVTEMASRNRGAAIPNFTLLLLIVMRP